MAHVDPTLTPDDPDFKTPVFTDDDEPEDRGPTMIAAPRPGDEEDEEDED